MSKLQRIYNDQSQYYFITTKTCRNKKIFDDEKKVKLLLQCLNYLIKRKYTKLFAWVILPNHIHLLLEIIGKKNISNVIQSIKGNFSWMVNRNIYDVKDIAHARKHELRTTNHCFYFSSVDQAFRPDRHQPCPQVMKIWQTSFYDHIIRNQRDFYVHLDYIHYNAVKHKYVVKPEDWPWSSYHIFLKREHYKRGWGYSIVPENLGKMKLE